MRLELIRRNVMQILIFKKWRKKTQNPNRSRIIIFWLRRSEVVSGNSFSGRFQKNLNHFRDNRFLNNIHEENNLSANSHQSPNKVPHKKVTKFLVHICRALIRQEKGSSTHAYSQNIFKNVCFLLFFSVTSRQSRTPSHGVINDDDHKNTTQYAETAAIAQTHHRNHTILM